MHAANNQDYMQGIKSLQIVLHKKSYYNKEESIRKDFQKDPQAGYFTQGPISILFLALRSACHQNSSSPPWCTRKSGQASHKLVSTGHPWPKPQLLRNQCIDVHLLLWQVMPGPAALCSRGLNLQIEQGLIRTLGKEGQPLSVTSEMHLRLLLWALSQQHSTNQARRWTLLLLISQDQRAYRQVGRGLLPGLTGPKSGGKWTREMCVYGKWGK